LRDQPHEGEFLAEAKAGNGPRFPRKDNVKMGWGTEREPDLKKGKALEGNKPQECYRHETRPGRPEEE
jgi:hypothetical protein